MLGSYAEDPEPAFLKDIVLNGKDYFVINVNVNAHSFSDDLDIDRVARLIDSFVGCKNRRDAIFDSRQKPILHTRAGLNPKILEAGHPPRVGQIVGKKRGYGRRTAQTKKVWANGNPGGGGIYIDDVLGGHRRNLAQKPFSEV